ncbi:hypothetical protein J6TS7_62570 [Paenibacillus dendritiformis]|nr:hypothetical protein J6TS7_62570 [Paenibacillus dendritiformis]
MIAFDEKAFYDRIGAINGWDFRSMRSVTEGAAWDYGPKVMELCKPTDVLLDIGTGGGEGLLTLAEEAGHRDRPFAGHDRDGSASCGPLVHVPCPLCMHGCERADVS